MSLKTFINKYRSNSNNSCTQSQASTSSVNSIRSPFPQQNHRPLSQSSAQSFQNGNMLRNNTMIPIEEEIKNQFNAQQSFISHNQQVYPNFQSRIQMGQPDSSQFVKGINDFEIRDSFITPVQGQTQYQTQSTSFTSDPFQKPSQQHSNFSQQNNENNKMYISRAFDTYQQQDTTQGQMRQSIHPAFYEEIQRIRVEQKDREELMKQELLIEIRGVKEFFKQEVMRELEVITNQSNKKQEEFSNILVGLKKKVESSAGVITKFLNDQQLPIDKRSRVLNSEYAKNLSDLHELVSQVKDEIENESTYLQNAIDTSINQSTKILFAKINSTKQSVKKQIITSTRDNKKKPKPKAKQTGQ